MVFLLAFLETYQENITIVLSSILQNIQRKQNYEEGMKKEGKKQDIKVEFNNYLHFINEKKSECTGEVLPKFSRNKLRESSNVEGPEEACFQVHDSSWDGLSKHFICPDFEKDYESDKNTGWSCKIEESDFL